MARFVVSSALEMLEIITKLPQNGCKTMEKKNYHKKRWHFGFVLKPLWNPLIEYYFYLTVDESTEDWPKRIDEDSPPAKKTQISPYQKALKP